MKKKLLALVCALVMIFSLASCGLSTPDTVGKVGDFEVSSGLYLLAQFSAYQQAAQLAGTDQDATDVKAFLKETITTDADSGETAVVQDYVADKTLETLRTFAAIDARFAELGGELTAEQTQVADNYAQQVPVQLACAMGLPVVTAATKVEVDGASATVERTLEDAVETVRVALPAVVAVTPDAALPRIPGMKDILAAGKKPAAISAEQAPTASVTEVVSCLAPESADRKLVVLDAKADGAIAEFAAALKAAL